MMKTLCAAALTALAALAPLQAAAQDRPEGAPPPDTDVADDAAHDPFERLNRTTFAVFEFLDPKVLRPPAVFYAHAVPSPLRRAVRRALSNLHEPTVIVNDVLQLHPVQAGRTLGRFAVNSTLGIGGAFDPAERIGLAYHRNGFASTLGRYGVPPGPYLFLLGPGDLRTAIGGAGDLASDPITWTRFPGRTPLVVSRSVLGVLDGRSQADASLTSLDRTATDRYAVVRSVYLQQRAAGANGGAGDVNGLPSFGVSPAPTNADPPRPAAAQAASN